MSKNTFKSLLVANRGEIAIRVLRAAAELELRTIALYTYEDRYSLHRYKADEAYQIGANDQPLKPYLNIEEIIQIAKRKNADAIHPGYGFLSENVEFARRCEEEGIAFIGPRSEVMAQLGDKLSAKEIARQIGVPVVEGTKVAVENLEKGLASVKDIGFPLIVKAAGGGGGRGMRVVRSESELSSALEDASTEAEKAFGDSTVYFERYIESPKHLEVQIMGDNQGNIVHLFERDCSVQRRFQKVVEIAPCPSIKEETRQKLYDYSLKIAKHVQYNNVGTVEFLVDRNEEIYFIEVNPRIQVEHTVTEEVTGVDIVRSQILIAQDHSLEHPLINISSQEDLSITGFAIQCRITTEDPTRDFRPDFGRVIAYRSPGGYGIRLDAGSAYSGAVISPYFDSLLVKVTASGRTLAGAAERVRRAIREFRIRGVRTNGLFLENVVSHPVFQSGDCNVDFMEDHPELFEFKQPRNRANKVLKLIGDVIVNGNPDVKRIDPAVSFRKYRVPSYDRYAEHPKGTKDKLNELGPDKFAEWLKAEKAIHYTDTTFRDAHQSLLATRVRGVDMIRVAESFAKRHPDMFSMEVWGGATFDVCLRFLKECPWERLKLMREAMPNVLLQMLLRGSNAVGYSAYPDNLIVSFIEKTWETGIDVFRIFDSLNWLPAMETSIKTVRERTGGLAEVCISYTGDVLDPERKKYNLDYYLDLAKRIEDAGAHILCIKDMAGLLHPYAAELLISKLKEQVGLPIHLHTHDTSSMQSATYLKAIEAGVDVVDVALASMSGLTSQPNFNSLAHALKGHERERPMDMDSLNRFSNYWEVVREFYYPFESGLKAGTAEVYKHEIPGGQYSNLGPQARGLGLENQFEEIKQNYIDVNAMLGDLVKVTPSSKVVGDMAMFMTSNGLTKEDVEQRADELSFPESLKSFFRGELGQPHGGFPKKLQKAVLKNEKPFSGRANEHLAPIDLEAEFTAFLEQFGQECSYLDFLSFKLYPKVFNDFYQYVVEYGQAYSIPTPVFFYGLKPDQEVMLDIAPGKTLMVSLQYVGEANDHGIRTIVFNLNGQARGIEVLDRSAAASVIPNKKASGASQVGSPLQGKLSEILVKQGQLVEKGEPLFVIEAMKMESTVSAPCSGEIRRVELEAGALVESDDLIIEFSD